MKNIPIYNKTRKYAIEHDEVKEYKASLQANMACKEAVTKAISRNYRNWICDTDAALQELQENFSLERIAVVTAVSIRPKDWDGRISNENKAWAKSFPFPENVDEFLGYDTNIQFGLTEVHPGLVNLFVDAVRKALQQEDKASS